MNIYDPYSRAHLPPAIGWLPLHRSILLSWLWEDKPFAFGQAWMDLVMFARYEEGSITINNQLIMLGIGQQLRGQATLCEAWGWTRGRVRHFIKMLCDLNMIQTTSVGKYIVIGICNFEESFLHVQKHFSEYSSLQPDDNHISNRRHNTTQPNYDHEIAPNITSKQVNNITKKQENNFLKGDEKFDESLPGVSERKARAAQKRIGKFFFDHLDENKLQTIWNELGLIQVAEISSPIKQQAYLRYREFIEKYHGDDVFSPLVNNLELDEVEDSYQSYFTESQLLAFVPDPTFWVCSYLVNSFQNYVTEYHRGKNPNQWVADLDFAFNRETYRKVTDKDGEDFHYKINEVPFVRGIKVNQ